MRIKSLLDAALGYTYMLLLGLSPAIGLAVVVFALEVYSGSGGALDEQCEIRAIQSRAFQFLWTRRFWREQVAYLDGQIAFESSEPERLAADIAATKARIAAEVAKLDLKPVEKSPVQAQAEALRAAADEIENREAEARHNRQRLMRIRALSQCRAVAALKLQAVQD